MNIYIASSFELKDKVLDLVKKLEAKGHKITCRWWLIDFKKEVQTETLEDWYSVPLIRVICTRSLRSIDRSDALILVCPDNAPRKFNGANIELGYAIARNIPVISFGQIDQSAMYESLIRTHTFAELFTVLAELEK
jgi:nucleoside 2-deoxyribosyltransferase